MDAHPTLAKQTRRLALTHSGLAVLLGLGLVFSTERAAGLLTFFQSRPDPATIGLLRSLGALLASTGLPLWLLPWTGLEDHQEKSLSFLGHAVIFLWLLLPLLSADPERSKAFAALFLVVLFVAAGAIRLQWGGRLPAGASSPLDEAGERAARQERNRLARDLHDSIKQQLFSIKMSSAAAEERWERDPGGARAALADVRRGAQFARVEMQAMLAQLRPEALAGVGLVDALREQCEALGYRLGILVGFAVGDLPEEERLPAGAREDLFRIAQEALSNVARHARPQSVQVRLEADGTDLVLSVRDDGQGFDPAAPSAGLGLRGMRERLAARRGRLEVESASGRGTVLSARVPLAEPPPDERDEVRLHLAKEGVVLAVFSFLELGPTLPAVFLVYAGKLSLKGLPSRVLSQQLVLTAAMVFWWSCVAWLPAADPEGDILKSIAMLAWMPWVTAPLSLACWPGSAGGIGIHRPGSVSTARGWSRSS